MVSLRGRGRGSRAGRRSAAGRQDGSELSSEFTSEDDEQSDVDSESQEEEEQKTERVIIRKSLRLLSSTGRPRRSTRTTKPADRYKASEMFDGISTSHVTRSVLNTMDSTKKRRLGNSSEGKFYSTERRRGAPGPQQRDLSDSESDREFPRGTFRISASGPNTTRRGAFRPTESPWSNQSDEEDSDEEVQNNGKFSGSWRPLGDLLRSRQDKMSSGAGLADIDPMAIDQSVGFNSIGGLSGHISALKEMVVFPLLYPEVFENFKIQPPRGCLFYGPPGTGKTLVARALANECSHGNRRVSFFMRKGADCLSKWVGESERQLRLLFEQAYQARPSIIFFDEIDGLAPVRSSRQDQIHSSIVSTLLALMDGLDNRGEVVVIGATNRLDTIDPALRRPGRFDREFLFGLPDRESRKEILKIHTMRWSPPPSDDFLDELAEKCVGYCGADIRAVCTEAALCALRRRYPQIYCTPQKLLLDVSSIAVSGCDFVAAIKKMTPASRRLAGTPPKPLSAVVRPLLSAALQDVLEALQRLFPHAEQGMKRKREPDLTTGVLDDGLMSHCQSSCTSNISFPSSSRGAKFLHFSRSAVRQPTSHRPRMLLVGRPGSGQTSHLAPAVLHALERFPVHSLDSAVLFGVSSTTPEEACAQVFMEAKRTSPSILYLPHIQQWWEAAGPALRASFLSLLGSIPSFSPVLLLATCSVPHPLLDPEIEALFRERYGEIYTVGVPTRQQRTNFFQDLILNQAAEALPSKTKSLTQSMEVLPLAPTPPPRPLPDEERRRLEEQEEDVLRKLRLFLRSVTERLSLDRQFQAFTKAVDMEEAPDYPMMIKKPMDLCTLLTNINEHKYATVGEFMRDADLIWKNALKYSANRDPTDRHIRHHACALKDTVRALVRDELDGDFERLCEDIREARLRRACGSDADFTIDGGYSSRAPKKKPYKRPRKTKWSAGILPKPKKKKPRVPPPSPSSSPSSSLLSESDLSESSSEQSQSGITGALVNGYHRPKPNSILRVGTQTRKVPQRKTRVRSAEGRQRSDSRAHEAAVDQMFRRSEEQLSEETPRLIVDHNKLKDLLSRVVSKTDGAEVELLEKLYARLAQSIYRHRDNYNKAQLIQEMKKDIDGFS